ncbi:LOW QUALITY PROTEIN: ataxin-2-like protein [Myripristis murdjan]|uniref:LOW QUALITY PROTEIN: ataxin-2-like protein n=1 Tax=Myripristis murdjan TaxID=586833 RepID=UPI001175D243|nr:LOW QUALITY PROTEIN: ataxin-2-like protein [Myripristis murdjan]
MHMTKKTRNTMKPPSQTQSTPVFEGVYNNARMLHFLTAVVGSTCDVRVKNGTVYEGIFKTLSSQCELAVDAVHKRSEGATGDGGGGSEGGGGGGGQSTLPKIEEITDTMIFSPTDLVTMTCRDVDLNFAIKDTFTDTAISSSRVNGDIREKVLQRWDGGDINGENYDLEADTSNGWDANEMFKFNEEAYGVKSTYDSSLSMYTVPLERGSSEVYRQREARAARLASEIESSLQYRRRVSLENDEGRSEEDRYSAVVREREERGSPGFNSGGREGKYIPLPQRARDISMSASSGRGGASARSGAPSSSRHSAPSSSSPRPSSDRSSPLSVRTACSPHQSQSSLPAASSPPCSNHSLPHSLSHPQALADTTRSSVNGVASRTSPKSQRPQSNRTLRTPNSQSAPAASRSPKPDAPPPDLPLVGPTFLDSSPSTVTTATTKPSGPTPLFPVDVNEILSSAAKERAESLASPQENKSSKAPSVQQRSQLEELRKFGKEFRLQPSSSPSAAPSSSEPPQPGPIQAADSSPSSTSSTTPPKSANSPSSQDLQQTPEGATSTTAPTATTPTPTAPAIPQAAGPDGQLTGTPQPAGTPGSEEPRPESSERAEATSAAAAHVKNSTLNPNAKEFLPIKGPTPLKPASTPTPPRPTPPSPSVVLPPPPGQPGAGAIYSSPPGHYLSYMSPITIPGHSIQAPQMYQYTMSTVNQGKYTRAKGPVVGPRPEHHASPASPMIPAASATGPPLVASPYPQSYLQYGQVIQAMPPHYHGQAVYSMLQGGARMLTSGAPQPMGPPGPQYPGQAEGPPGPQQALYAAQSFSHHSGSMHPPQPSSTPTGSQAPPQHTAPSPGHNQQSSQGGPQPQSIYHSGGLSAPTPPNLPPGHSSPQASYPMQGYSLPAHQAMPHGFPAISQLTQAHVAGGMSGPHHNASHGPPPVMLHYAPPQQGAGSTPQHGPPPQQGAPQHYYIGPPQAVQVQAHPTQQLSFHTPGN